MQNLAKCVSSLNSSFEDHVLFDSELDLMLMNILLYILTLTCGMWRLGVNGRKVMNVALFAMTVVFGGSAGR